MDDTPIMALSNIDGTQFFLIRVYDPIALVETTVKLPVNALSPKKSWAKVVTTNSSGVWSADFTTAGFSSPPVIQATCVGGTGASNAINANMTGDPTNTGVSGIAIKPIISALGLITVQAVGAGTKVHINARESD